MWSGTINISFYTKSQFKPLNVMIDKVILERYLISKQEKKKKSSKYLKEYQESFCDESQNIKTLVAA